MDGGAAIDSETASVVHDEPDQGDTATDDNESDETESDDYVSADESAEDESDEDADEEHSDCSVELKEAVYSETIGTVGVVTWSTTLAEPTKAQIDFGLDTEYGLAAPVDLDALDYRTILLGMKENAGPYHFRITVQSEDASCTSDDYIFDEKTASHPDDLKPPVVDTVNESTLFGGFLITVGYMINSPEDDYVFIVDGDGDLVWWYKPEGFRALSTARMSYDGRHMWIVHSNVPSVEGRVGRIKMDGTEWEDMRETFPKQHHDMTVLPDETIAYLSYNWYECDDITERSPNGDTKVLINSGDAFGNPTVCHGNAIQYSPWDDTYVISDTNENSYFKIDREGNILWVLGADEHNSFDQTGDGASTWVSNHNVHLLGEDRILFFNNGNIGSLVEEISAVVRELVLDFDTMTTSMVWRYEASPPVSSRILGDVQRLPNGNTVIAFSASGIVHEVNPEGALLQELYFGEENMIGYITKRESLYGPPPR